MRLSMSSTISEPGMVAKFAEKCGLPPREILNVFQKDFWAEITPGEMNRLVTLLIERAVVWKDHLEFELKTSGLMPLMEEIKNAVIEVLPNGNVKIVIPISLRSCSGRKHIVAPVIMENPTEPIVQNIVRACR